MTFEYRPYQEECINIINSTSSGRYLIVMATGLGKTYIFSRINRKGRMLILSHREELVLQPKKFFSCEFGIELNKTISNGEEVVSASTSSLVAHERYKKFSPNEFDTIVVDEAHHSPAKTYRILLDYFKPRLLLGFTATPNRGDGVRLDDIYTDIIYEKDIKWGIENKYLSKVECIRVSAAFDLTKVHTSMGDYKVSELDKIMINTDGVVVDAYNKYAHGATLIFTVSVEQAERLQKRIPNSVVVKASTPNREEIVNQLRERVIDCIINCMIFTEGTDIPLCETIIIARPTKSSALYSQMVGRGLRNYPGKDKLRLIDIVGVTVDNRLCTAPSLLGIDMRLLDKKHQDKIEGDLLSLPDKVLRESDCPASWVKSAEYVNLWADENKYNLRNVNWIQYPDGSLRLRIPRSDWNNRPYAKEIELTTPDELGFTTINGRKMKMQAAIDFVYNLLNNCYKDCEIIWNTRLAMKTWGSAKATDKQISSIKKSKENLDGVDFDTLTKFQASLILNRIFSTPPKLEAESKASISAAKQKSYSRDDSQRSSAEHRETKPYRSAISYLLWRYPRINNEHNVKMLKLMYGSIPKYMLDDDAIYYSIVKTEGDRINKYGKTNPYSFNDAAGAIAEFSKLSYYLVANHIRDHKILKCSKALIYCVRSLRDKLTPEERWALQDDIESTIADFAYAGGNYNMVSSRVKKIIEK